MIAYAIKNRAVQAVKTRTVAVFGLIFAVSASVAVLAGCSALPDKPVRPVLYDFGPGSVAPQTVTREAPLPPVGLEDITTVGGALDNTALLYRLAYTNEQQLRPYAEARWTSCPKAARRWLQGLKPSVPPHCPNWARWPMKPPAPCASCAAPSTR